jgi:signal transduction histidine kinase
MLKKPNIKYPVMQLLQNEETPYAIADRDQFFVWSNFSFKEFCKKHDLNGNKISSCFKNINITKLEEISGNKTITVPLEELNSMISVSILQKDEKFDGYFVKIKSSNELSTEDAGLLQKNLLFLKELQNILTLLIKQRHLAPLTEEILEKIVTISKGDFGIIVFHDQGKKNEFLFYDTFDFIKNENEIEKHINANFLFLKKWLSVNKKTLITLNNPADIGYNISSSLQSHSLVITPCFFDGKLLAAVIIGKKYDSFNNFDVNIIEQFAALLSFAVSSVKTRELNAALENRLLQSQKLETIGKLSSGMAHDFSNLLSSIFGSVNLLKKRIPPKEDLHRLLDNIESCSIRARDLTRGLLSYGKPTSKRKETVKPNILVDEIVKVVTQTFPKNINCRTDIESNLFEIKGNGTEIYQVLLNLCVNAKEAINNSGEISIKAKNINVNGENRVKYPMLEKGNFVHLGVSDTGSGINEENLQKIFDPYFSTKHKETGSGLGLYVTYGIVKAHSGHIEVSSRKDKGTTFDVYFPALEVSAGQLETSVTDKIILLADDELMLQDLLAELLESNGYTVIKVASGIEALRVLTEEIKVDLLILDYNMPEMNGLECVRKIRELKLEVPIILSSGSLSLEDNFDIKKEGINKVLPKPYEFDSMLQVIQKFI